jgi:hypothetical protein
MTLVFCSHRRSDKERFGSRRRAGNASRVLVRRVAGRWRHSLEIPSSVRCRESHGAVFTRLAWESVSRPSVPGTVTKEYSATKGQGKGGALLRCRRRRNVQRRRRVGNTDRCVVPVLPLCIMSNQCRLDLQPILGLLGSQITPPSSSSPDAARSTAAAALASTSKAVCQTLHLAGSRFSLIL